MAEPFESVEDAQAEVDRWVVEYNTDRPHQALDDKLPVTPDDRFEAVPPRAAGAGRAVAAAGAAGDHEA